MSPFCLIDVAGIREHAGVAHDARESTWQARFSRWINLVFNGLRR
jgi:hypothetical protein